jgi:hypothetical protein
MKRRRAPTGAFSLFAFQDIITSVTGVIILVTLLLAVELIKRPPVQDGRPQGSATEDLESQIAAMDRELEALSALVQEDSSFLRESASLSSTDLEQARIELARRVAETEYSIKEMTEILKQSIDRRSAAEFELSRTETVSLPQILAENAALTSELDFIKSSNQVVYNQSPGAQKAAWLIDLEADRIRVLKPGHAGVTVEFSEFSEAERIGSFVEWARTRDLEKDYFVLLVRPESIRVYQAVYEKSIELKYDLGFDLVASETAVTVVFPSKRAPQ